jgi:LysR family transcriptional activator of nhaA
LLQPVIDTAGLRLLCHENGFDGLLADLALHRLDVVLADRAAPPNGNLRLYSQPLGTSPLARCGASALVDAACHGFPKCLADLPVLLPTAHAAVRGRLGAIFCHCHR